jgi:Domain of unknown function (DUF4395)
VRLTNRYRFVRRPPGCSLAKLSCWIKFVDIRSETMRRLLGFPNPVNEVAARTVAAGVVIECVAFLATGWHWLLIPLAFGFVARVLTGPKLSPLGRLATEVVVPRLPFAPRLVPGPPKRFAQGIGATLSGTALIAAFAGAHGVAVAAIAAITFAATLESVFAVCLGCTIFRALMRVGVVPASVCAECADITSRLATAAGTAVAARSGTGAASY